MIPYGIEYITYEYVVLIYCMNYTVLCIKDYKLIQLQVGILVARNSSENRLTKSLLKLNLGMCRWFLDPCCTPTLYKLTSGLWTGSGRSK